MGEQEKESGLSKKDIDQLQKDIRNVRAFIREIEAMGGTVPSPLKTALKGLETSIAAGKAVGEAAEEASEALKAYEKDLQNACKTVDAEMQGVCEAKVARKYQLRSVQFTLDYRNPDSVTSKVLDKLIKKFTPGLICRNWDRCAKIDQKK